MRSPALSRWWCSLTRLLASILVGLYAPSVDTCIVAAFCVNFGLSYTEASYWRCVKRRQEANRDEYMGKG